MTISSSSMGKAPSLVSLGIEAIRKQLVSGDDAIPDVYELPSHLFDILVTKLPPLALHNLLRHLPFKDWNDYEQNDDCIKTGRKRGRIGNFDAAWKALFELRWPKLGNSVQLVDWQQIYWQTHLQNCLNEAAELASLPSFNGCIGEMRISDAILKCIGCEGDSNYSKLSYHCQQFGQYARCLRLQSVLCVAETCELLSSCKLQTLLLHWIRSEEHVEALCKFLIQNKETLTSLDLIYCKLSPTLASAIFQSLDIKNETGHGLQSFSIKASSFLEPGTVSLPVGLVSFLSSGRSLSSLRFCDSHLDKNHARMLFSTLISASSSLSILDLSDNNIAGWLCKINLCFPSNHLSSFGTSNFLQSLQVLNIRGNNLRKDDMESLRNTLARMPNLESLDISENPIEDDGIRCLIPYFVDAPGRRSSLANLSLEDCELSCDGVILLLDTLSTLQTPFNSLSLADNELGSHVARSLGKFLLSPIKAINIGGIGLGSTGFQELRNVMMAKLNLVEINVSKNRGMLETAKFLGTLISLAPQITTVNAAYNLMPLESLTIICSALKLAKGKLECLDLTGNNWDYQPTYASILAEFQHNGRPILVLPSTRSSEFSYDDDP